MLKTVSSVANALGALNYQGTWNASTNTPTLASGVGTQGDYYVVSVDGATNLDGITNWGVGDWAAFNGSVWQRVEGGADGNFVNLAVSGTSSLLDTVTVGNAGFADHYTRYRANDDYGVAVGMDASSNGGNGSLLLHGGVSKSIEFTVDTTGGFGAGTPAMTLSEAGNLTVATGNVVIGTSGQGIDFSATAGTGTSELLDDYEEGVHTTAATCTTSGTIGFVSSNNQLAYTKTGNTVHVSGYLYVGSVSSPVGGVQISLPFTAADLADKGGASVASLYLTNVVASNVSDFVGKIDEGNDFLLMYLGDSNIVQNTSAQQIKAGSQIYISITYKAA